MRILPRANDEVNEEWISDKTRHVVDGLRTQRLDQPYVRVDGRLQPASWREAFSVIADKMKTTGGKRAGAIVGDLAGAEEMFALKDLMMRLGSANIDARQDGSVLDSRGSSRELSDPGVRGSTPVSPKRPAKADRL